MNKPAFSFVSAPLRGHTLPRRVRRKRRWTSFYNREILAPAQLLRLDRIEHQGVRLGAERESSSRGFFPPVPRVQFPVYLSCRAALVGATFRSRRARLTKLRTSGSDWSRLRHVKPILHLASARFVSSKRTLGTRIRLAELGTRLTPAPAWTR